MSSFYLRSLVVIHQLELQFSCKCRLHTYNQLFLQAGYYYIHADHVRHSSTSKRRELPKAVPKSLQIAMFCLRAFQKLAKQTQTETHTENTDRDRDRELGSYPSHTAWKRKETRKQGEEQKRNLAKCRRIRKQEPGKKAQKEKKTEDPRRISSSELLLQIFVLEKGLRKPKF